MNERVREAMTSSARQNYGTPMEEFSWWNWCFRFTVDACAEKWNAKLRRYWSAKDNGLAQDGRREIVWDNPEYDSVVKWLKRSKEESILGGVWVNLVASRPDTRWFRDAIEKDMGRLLRSYFVPETRVWWLLWEELVVGVYHHDARLVFDVPPGTLDKKGRPMKSEPAPFPSSLIIHAARARWRIPKLRPASTLRLYQPLKALDLPDSAPPRLKVLADRISAQEAADTVFSGRRLPLLTYRMPE